METLIHWGWVTVIAIYLICVLINWHEEELEAFELHPGRWNNDVRKSFVVCMVIDIIISSIWLLILLFT